MPLLTAKLKRLQELLAIHRLDGLIIGNFGHQIADDFLYYLLLKKLELGLLFVPAKGKPTLFAIPFEVAMLTRRYDPPAIIVRPYTRAVPDMLVKHAKSGARLAIRESALPVVLYQHLQKQKTWKLIAMPGDRELRAVKLPEEIRYLKEAARITDRLFGQLIKQWSKFKREADAARWLHEQMIALGVEPSFPTIIASGKHAADPHHATSDAKIQKGFCVIDMGVRHQGYCSDMTRTIYVGTPSDKEKALYKKLQSAQTATAAKVRAGVNTAELDKFCRQELGPALNRLFIHGLGHGVDTQVHEWPSVTEQANNALEENMLITIEPGLYQTGRFGMRIEDDVLVTKTGRLVLTRSSRSLVVV